jgi:hypothetical protein
LALRQRLLRELVFRTVSQIGINYRESHLSQEAPDADFARSAPLPGDRVPYVPVQGRFPGSPHMMRGTKLHLVNFAGASQDSDLPTMTARAIAGFGDLVECHNMPLNRETQTFYRVFGLWGPGYYLIRPDGYIATRGVSLESGDLGRYLSAILRRAPGEV